MHADLSAGDALMRDSARFHFGFTVPFVAHMGAAAVVAAVSASKGDLGLVPAFAVPAAGAWWSALEFDAAPKIIARLPFVERADHPAAPAGVRDLAGRRRRHGDRCGGLERARLRLGRRRGAGALGARRFHRHPDRAFDGAALLITLPKGVTLEAISAALVKAGATVRSAALVGSHATRYTVAAERA